MLFKAVRGTGYPRTIIWKAPTLLTLNNAYGSASVQIREIEYCFPTLAPFVDVVRRPVCEPAVDL